MVKEMVRRLLILLRQHPGIGYGLPVVVTAGSTYLFVLGTSYHGPRAYAAIGLLFLFCGLLAGLRVTGLVIGLTVIAVVVLGPSLATESLEWTETDPPEPWILFHQTDDPGPSYMRVEYGLEDVVDEAEDDLARLLSLTGWVTSRWSHSGTNMPSRPDPLTILREAEAGASFRCVEYSTVMVGAAQAMGMPARTIGLKTRRAATAASSAGHVVVEVWLETHQKWAMVDPQFGYIPVLDGILLNAVELQQALADGNRPTLLCPEGPVGWLGRTHYLLWIGPYLFYFESAADQRVFNDPAERSGGALMLVPEGAPQLEVFQRRFPLTGYRYTSCVDEFYPVPNGRP